MSNEFDRQKLLANISTLIQQKGMKIGELETSVGVSAGYLSRLSKEDNKTIPALDVIWRIAKTLGVNIELLIDGNFDHATENIEYLRKFIQKLFEKTVAGEMDWDSFNISAINAALHNDGYVGIVEYNRNGPPYTPHDSDMRQLGYDHGSEMSTDNRRIRSATRPKDDVVAADSCFRVPFGDHNILWLAKFAETMLSGDDFDPGEPEIVEWYELSVEDARDEQSYPEGICNTLWTSASLLPDIEKLYQELKTHEYDLRIKQNVRQAIDAFMLSEDDLPF